MKQNEEKNLKKEVSNLSLEQIINYKRDYLQYKLSIYNSDATIVNVNNYINVFISFCKKNNMKRITKEVIHNYIIALESKKKSTKDKYLKNLKLFFKYLFEQELINADFSRLIPKTKYLYKSKIPFYWSEENINKLLNAIDCNTDIGKRDYAILLLAIRLGIRAGDIIRLTLDNIDWNNNQIKFYQHKTTEIQCLPLLSEVGNSILDYIKNARNNALNTRILFLNDNMLDIINSSNKISRILIKYEKKANILVDKSFKNGIHSFRNTLARNLLINEYPLATISQVLGHVNPNTARIYLKIDTEQLRKCVLDWRNF